MIYKRYMILKWVTLVLNAGVEHDSFSIDLQNDSTLQDASESVLSDVE